MKEIRLLDLGFVSALHSQTVYHAVGHAMTEDSPDTIILVTPDQRYVCIGYHQDLEQEIDLDYCRARAACLPPRGGRRRGLPGRGPVVLCGFCAGIFRLTWRRA
jgi:hypothetical protein